MKKREEIPLLELPKPAPDLISSAVAFKVEAARLLKTPTRGRDDATAPPAAPAAAAEPSSDAAADGLLARSPRGRTAMVLTSALAPAPVSLGNAAVTAKDKALWAAAAQHAASHMAQHVPRQERGRAATRAPRDPAPEPEPEPEAEAEPEPEPSASSV